MEWCPFCSKLVNVIIHKYHYEWEDVEEKRCEFCGKTIVVDHYTKVVQTGKKIYPEETSNFKHREKEKAFKEKSFKKWLNRVNRKMMRGIIPNEDF